MRYKTDILALLSAGTDGPQHVSGQAARLGALDVRPVGQLPANREPHSRRAGLPFPIADARSRAFAVGRRAFAVNLPVGRLRPARPFG